MGFSILFGTTAIPAGNAVAPVVPPTVVTLTAYNAVPGQTDSTPYETASGAYSNPEIIAARSVDLKEELPFGTIIELDGTNASPESCGYSVVESRIGYRVIEDSMNPRYTKRIDVLFGTDDTIVRSNGSSMNAARVLGICEGITYRVVGHIGKNPLPKTQAELAAIVKKAHTLARK